MAEQTEIVKPRRKNQIQKAEKQEISYNELIEIAIKSNADVDKLGKLLDLKNKYEDRQAEKAYVESMSQFRAECPEIFKTKSGHNSKYAPLFEIVNSIKDIELKHGLTHIWKTEQSEKEIKVICRVIHIGGHYEETSMVAAADKTGSKNDIQAIGSTISYLERYTLCALYGIATADMDDDGGKPPEPEQPKSQSKLIEKLVKDAFDEFVKKNSKLGLEFNYEKFKTEMRNQFKQLSEAEQQSWKWDESHVKSLAEKININAIVEKKK